MDTRTRGSALPWRPALVLVLVAALVGGCAPGGSDDVSIPDPVDCRWTAGELPVVAELDARLAAYVRTELTPDTGHLDAGEAAVLAKLVEAARIMNELVAAQATPCREELTARIDELPALQQAGVRRYFRINNGPWDRRFHFEPFFGTWHHPEGANYYPRDLTAQEKAAIADPGNGLDGLFTMVRRDSDGALVAIPYSEYFREELTLSLIHISEPTRH